MLALTVPPRLITLENGIVITDVLWNGTPCWRWLGIHSHGRPVFDHVYVYRILYERERGSIPPGHINHHGCEHEWCINPWHVEAITRAKHGDIHGNVFQASKTHCKNGHPFDEVNTYRWRNKRFCRACNRMAQL